MEVDIGRRYNHQNPCFSSNSTDSFSLSFSAKFLFSLGLSKAPSIDVLLPLAAITIDAPLRTAALDYLLSHFQEFYSVSYHQSASRNLAFVPSIKPDGSAFLSTPSEVFTNPEVAVMGFPVVASSFRNDATSKLRILSDPAPTLLVESLATSPPLTVEKAKICFDVSSLRVLPSLVSSSS